MKRRLKHESPTQQINKRRKVVVEEDNTCSQSSDITDSQSEFDSNLEDLSQTSSQSSVQLEDSQSSSSSFGYQRQQRHYYLKNFVHILQTVLDKDSHLFKLDERSCQERLSESYFLTAYRTQLSKKSQRLFVRLYNRKWQWFHTSKLTSKYANDFSQEEEIDEDQDQDCIIEEPNSFDTIIDDLVTSGFLEKFVISDDPETVTENEKILRQILHTLTIAELELVSKKLRKFAPSKKLQDTKRASSGGKKSPKAPSPKKLQLIDLILNDKKASIESAEKKKQKTIHSFFKATSQSPGTEKPASSNLKTVFDALSGQLNTQFVKVTAKAREVFRRIHQLYFLQSGVHDASIMVIESKNIMKFPAYEYKPISVFKTREDLDRYEEALSLISYSGDNEMEVLAQFQQDEDMIDKGELEISIETIEKAATGLCTETARYRQGHYNCTANVADVYLLRFTAGWIYAKIVCYGVNILEQSKNYEKATYHLQELLDSPFVSGRRGLWWNRLALDLQHMGKNKEALEICLSALKEDRTLRTAQRYTLEKRVERLNQKCKSWTNVKKSLEFLNLKTAKDIYIKSRLTVPGKSSRKSRFLAYDGKSSCDVESLALQYYTLKNRFSKGVHSEGSVWSAIFSLLFWDIIYDSSVPNVFQSKYQATPLDLGTEAFWISREETIKKRLATIADNENSFISNQLQISWSENHGLQSCISNWDNYDILELVEICECFSGKVISAVCKMLAEDYRHNRSGMPDLILWCPNEKKALFSEVKGPRDRLSDKQRAWIDVLIASGAEVEICHIVEDHVVTKTKKKQIEFDDDDLWLVHNKSPVKAEEHLEENKENVVTIIEID